MGQGLSRNGARPAYLSPQRSDRGGRVETPDCQHFPRVRSPVGAARHGPIADARACKHPRRFAGRTPPASSRRAPGRPHNLVVTRACHLTHACITFAAPPLADTARQACQAIRIHRTPQSAFLSSACGFPVWFSSLDHRCGRGAFGPANRGAWAWKFQLRVGQNQEQGLHDLAVTRFALV